METDWINYTFFGFAVVLVLFYLIFRHYIETIACKFFALEHDLRDIYGRLVTLDEAISDIEKDIEEIRKKT